MIIAVIILLINMIMATQYAVTKIGYEYSIVHPSNANIRFIGSDNTTGGRVLRMDGGNLSGSLKIYLGNWSTGTKKMYSAAFGIVNEEQVPVSITHINVSSSTHNYTYMKIYLHGDRDANGNNTAYDPTSVLMFDNHTIVNSSDTLAWTLAPGNNNPNDMCSNVSNRTLYSTNTTWDNQSHVRYSLNDSNAYGVGMMNRTIYNASDFVWVQVAIDIPQNADSSTTHTGIIYVHFKAVTNS